MLSRTHVRQLRTVERDDQARLKFAMEKAGVTQEQLEDASGVSQSSISKILNRKPYRLSAQTAVRLASTLGCDITDLFPSLDSKVAAA